MSVEYDKWCKKIEKFQNSINQIDIKGKDILKLKEPQVYFLSYPSRISSNYSVIVVKENNKVIHYCCDLDDDYNYLCQVFPNIYNLYDSYFYTPLKEPVKTENESFAIIDSGFGSAIVVRKNILNEFNELLLKELEESDYYQEPITYASWEYIADKILNK